MKIAVAMSGGIDSSVAAALLKQEGHEVFGVTMKLTDNDNNQNAIESARRAATKLEIPHHAIDLRDIFERVIIADFCREYSLGNTPNPCILCNRYIKFGVLWEKARELGAELLATGHYARTERDKTSGRYLLKKGKDRQKDQSYFLYRLTQEQLAHTLFPIGNLTKETVKRVAAELKLPAVKRPESQEICFIPGADYINFLKDHATTMPPAGPILDTEGNVLGQHEGIAFYTMGQRKGLGITSAKPLYVIDIEPAKNAVIVGSKEQAYADVLIADSLNWTGGTMPEKPTQLKASIRYRHTEAGAEVSPRGEDSVYAKFTEPQMAVTPGQSVVFYDMDTVIGGGTIIRKGR
ncbi:MAG: tRNA 2-thiouridine(34) synthase MnmA [Dehalococcoidales bacterium]|nr:tRNA 2-thiouridine(34) synthase MnmA [Dehalococcoidales bacterium]